MMFQIRDVSHVFYLKFVNNKILSRYKSHSFVNFCLFDALRRKNFGRSVKLYVTKNFVILNLLTLFLNLLDKTLYIT